jgi:hypothetical protein
MRLFILPSVLAFPHVPYIKVLVRVGCMVRRESLRRDFRLLSPNEIQPAFYNILGDNKWIQ